MQYVGYTKIQMRQIDFHVGRYVYRISTMKYFIKAIKKHLDADSLSRYPVENVSTSDTKMGKFPILNLQSVDVAKLQRDDGIKAFNTGYRKSKFSR